MIIAKNRNQLHVIKKYIDDKGIPCNLFDKNDIDFDDNVVKLLTIHSIKGLEFKVVFIVGLNEGTIPYITYQDAEDKSIQESIDRKLLYVGMTRANELLYMTSSETPSKFINEINPEFLRLNFRSRVRRFYSLPLDVYSYKDKIFDLYSNEEKVRQWMIKELELNYKYPSGLIDVEYRVNNFSKQGFVDIAVSIYKGNTRIPYIFIETKAFGKSLSTGVEQLKSYMSNASACQYGIVTDGNSFVVINSDFEEVDDIPIFNPGMLPSGLETFELIDLKHNENYTITRDICNKRDNRR